MQRDRASCVYVAGKGPRTNESLGSLDGLAPLVERAYFSRGIHFVLGADKLSK